MFQCLLLVAERPVHSFSAVHIAGYFMDNMTGGVACVRASAEHMLQCVGDLPAV